MRREEKRRETLFSWFAANKLEKREKTPGARLLNNRLILSFYPLLIVAGGFAKQKGSATRCVPSSNSRDFCFFLFPFSFGASIVNLKSNEVFNFMPSESVSKNSP